MLSPPPTLSVAKCNGSIIIIGTWKVWYGFESYFWPPFIILFQPPTAYPNPQIPPSPQRTFFAEVGSTGVLNCSLAPGRFLGQYYVTWTNTSQGFTYREIPRPSLSEVPTTTPFDPRYIINPVTFSLAISDVTLADSDPNFFCILGVEDPSKRQLELIWEQTLNVPLRLVVYSELWW